MKHDQLRALQNKQKERQFRFVTHVHLFSSQLQLLADDASRLSTLAMHHAGHAGDSWLLLGSADADGECWASQLSSAQTALESETVPGTGAGS